MCWLAGNRKCLCHSALCTSNDLPNSSNSRLCYGWHYIHTLSLPVFPGYIGKVSFLEKVGQTVAEMKQANPSLMFGEWMLPLLPVHVYMFNNVDEKGGLSCEKQNWNCTCLKLSKAKPPAETVWVLVSELHWTSVYYWLLLWWGASACSVQSLSLFSVCDPVMGDNGKFVSINVIFFLYFIGWLLSYILTF